MRASDYNIYIPLPDSQKYILIHGYSGAVDIANKEIVEFLQNFDKQDGDGDLAADQTLLATLRQRGYLTNRTPAEEQTMVAALAHVLHRHQSKEPTFGMMVTYDCNLRCYYCYEIWVRSKGRKWLEVVMDKPMADAAFKAMEEIGACQGTAILLYGGEPFLKRNRQVVDYILNQGWDRGYQFTAITNGVEMDGFLDLLGPDKIHNLQITLDGPPDIHDKRRIRPDGSGSFKDIVRNIDAALETGALITVRTNLDQRNMTQYAELARLFTEEGWVDRLNFRFYAFPVHGKKASATISRVELAAQLAAHTEEKQYAAALHSSCHGTGHEIKHKFRLLLEVDRPPTLHSAYCAANSNTYVFDPHGNLYPCMEIVGSDDEQLGRYYPELTLNEVNIQRWHRRIVTDIPECRACKYALLCGGGCTAQAMYMTSNTFTPFCDRFADLLKIYVPVAYREYLAERAREQAMNSSRNLSP